MLGILDQATQSRLAGTVGRLTHSRLMRQNLILLSAGAASGLGGFVYHAIAGRLLGPARYGEVASLIAAYTILYSPALVIQLVVARFSAQMSASEQSGRLRYMLGRTTVVVGGASAMVLVICLLLAIPLTRFLHLESALPLLWLGLALATIYISGIMRGALQGLQRFAGLAVNQVTEMATRATTLLALLLAGFGVTGAMTAVFLGALASVGVGAPPLAGLLRAKPEKDRLRSVARFTLPVALGTLGVIWLYNTDVILARHFLSPRQGGFYGGLNKIGTIIYFITWSVSQVMFPRVVEARNRGRDPRPLLLASVAIVTAIGLAGAAIFFADPRFVVALLFGNAFVAAAPLVPIAGLIGLSLSLDNLLVNYFLSIHDNAFVPLLAMGCLCQVLLISLFHHSLSQVVFSELSATLVLLTALAVRYMRTSYQPPSAIGTA